jgi:hypothetical protein
MSARRKMSGTEALRRELGQPKPQAPRHPEPTREQLIAELELLEEVCAVYADDEDRFLRDQGEPYCIPTEYGMKARAARHRFRERMAARMKAGG